MEEPQPRHFGSYIILCDAIFLIKSEDKPKSALNITIIVSVEWAAALAIQCFLLQQKYHRSEAI